MKKLLNISKTISIGRSHVILYPLIKSSDSPNCNIINIVELRFPNGKVENRKIDVSIPRILELMPEVYLQITMKTKDGEDLKGVEVWGFV